MKAFNRGILILLAILLTLPVCLQALDYEQSDEGLDEVEFEGGRSEFEFADIDNDGHVDFVSIGDHGSPNINVDQHGIMVFFGDGAGNWGVTMNGDFGYGGIAVGDVNNDGDWDVGYGMHHEFSDNDLGDQQIEVALGDGSGEQWEPWDDDLAVPQGDDDWYGMFGTDLGDLDNDGLLDIGSVSFGSGTGLHIYTNNGDGTWEDVFYFFDNNNSMMNFVFGDINNDGNLDFACTLENHEVYFGDGEGNWEDARGNLPVPPERWTYNGVDLGDVDRDGADDIALVNGDGGMEVWRYDTDEEEWQDISDGLPAEARSYRLVDLHDMDMDGWLDLVVGSPDGIEVWLQDPEGDDRWEREWGFEFEDFRSCSAVRAGGDVDHNGLPDIVVLADITTGFMQHRNFLHVFRETSDADELWVRPVEPMGSELFIAGSVRFIDWAAAVPEGDEVEIDLLFSARGDDGPWEEIVAGFPNGGRYQWEIPNVASEDCYIKYRLIVDEDTVEAITPDAFIVTGGEAVPELEVDPERIDFVDIEVDHRASQTLTLRNLGDAELAVEPVELAEGDVFSVDGGEEAFTIEAEGEVELTVIFEPPEEDIWFDTLFITSEGGDASVFLSGRTVNVAGPELELSPDSLEFGRVHVDSTVRDEVIIHNTGDRTARVVVAGPGAGDFAWEAVPGEELEADDSLVVEVEFTPLRSIRQSTRMVVSYQFGELSIPISGTGFGAPLLELSTENLNFGRVRIGDSDTLEFTIYCYEDTARVDIPGAGFGAFDWEDANNAILAPHDSLTVAVSFSPAVSGVARGELTVRYQRDELSVSLVGRGFSGPLVETSTDTLDFGRVPFLRLETRELRVFNRGEAATVINVAEAPEGAFYWEAVVDRELQPNDSLSIPVNFASFEEHEFYGLLTIESEGENLEVVLKAFCYDPVGVGLEGGPPLSFGIHGTIPNPFNSALQVDFALEHTAPFAVALRDINGRLVRLVDAGVGHAGTHCLQIQADGLASGTYWLVLQQRDRRSIRKIVLLR